jgi:hypothetical protein
LASLGKDRLDVPREVLCGENTNREDKIFPHEHSYFKPFAAHRHFCSSRTALASDCSRRYAYIRGSVVKLIKAFSLLIAASVVLFAQRGGGHGGGGGHAGGGGGGSRGGSIGGSSHFSGGSVGRGFSGGSVGRGYSGGGSVGRGYSGGISSAYRGGSGTYRGYGGGGYTYGRGHSGYGYGHGYGYGRGYGYGFRGGFYFGWPYYGYGFGYSAWPYYYPGYYDSYYDPGYYSSGYYDPAYNQGYDPYAYSQSYGATPPIVINQNAPSADYYSNQPAYNPQAAQRERPDHFLIAFPNGQVTVALAYWVDNGILHYVTSDKQQRTVPLAQINRALTEQLNRELGFDMRLQ